MRRCSHVLHTTSLLPGSPYRIVGLIKPSGAAWQSVLRPVRRPLLRHSSTLRKPTLDNNQFAALNDVLEASAENTEDRYLCHEKQRDNFSAALRTLQVMTPRPLSTGRTATIRDWVENNNDDFCGTGSERNLSRSRLSLPRFNDHFWEKLWDLTRSRAKSIADTSARLKDLFDDPYSARDLNVEAYTIVVSFCVRTNDFSLLRHFMEHAQKSQVVPDTILANTMLGIFVNIPSLAGWSAALQVFAMLRLQADTSTWNQLLALSDPCQKLIVFDRMQALAVPRDNVTLGSLIPLARAQYGSTHSFLENLDYGKWDPRLGDTLIGHLLSLRDSQTCIDLLKNTKFPVTIEGYNQVISHLRKIPALKVNHQKLARTICQSLVDRGSAPNMDTFLFLFRLSGFIRTKDYGDMIYNVACESGLASKELRLARKAQVRQRRRDAFVLSSPPISWRQWLAK